LITIQKHFDHSLENSITAKKKQLSIFGRQTNDLTFFGHCQKYLNPLINNHSISTIDPTTKRFQLFPKNFQSSFIIFWSWMNFLLLLQAMTTKCCFDHHKVWGYQII
jgi:hypothetical protein